MSTPIDSKNILARLHPGCFSDMEGLIRYIEATYNSTYLDVSTFPDKYINSVALIYPGPYDYYQIHDVLRGKRYKIVKRF